jgi:putative transcriptional regulator
MEGIPYSQIEKGTFLISTPDVEMGIFFRSVVLICEHNPNGSFGLVINKLLNLELPPEIVNMNTLLNPHVTIHAGGPIQTNQMMLLHNNGEITNQTLKVTEGVYLGGDLAFLQEALADEQGPNLLLCFGYTGWGPGQLEREFLDGGWFVWPANAHHIFETPADKLWATLLREMGGRYASLSMIPEDLSLN